MASSGNARRALRPDTTVVEVGGRKARELYLRQMPGCCLRAMKEETVRGIERRETFTCSECEREWRVESSLDERVLARFAVEGEIGFGGPAA